LGFRRDSSLDKARQTFLIMCERRSLFRPRNRRGEAGQPLSSDMCQFVGQHSQRSRRIVSVRCRKHDLIAACHGFRLVFFGNLRRLRPAIDPRIRRVEPQQRVQEPARCSAQRNRRDRRR
jgi:hypothetical protein